MAQSDNDVLMTVGNADVTVGEFRYIYEKNNGEKADYSKESLDEYLELYKKFKLKVQKAKAMKLDTIQVLKDELAGYRKQLASSFLSDKEVVDYLVEEIHERKRKDVRIQHILLKVKENAPDEQKRQAEQKINDIIKEYQGGKTFLDLAAQYSEDKNTRKTEGDLGFITAMLPSGFYELENAIYNNEKGDLVGPVWSKLGCHLIKIKKNRPARGSIKVAHILLKQESKVTKDLVATRDRADSIYTAMQGGASWDVMVEKYSQDVKTKSRKGELPVFGIATYEKAFEDAAFKLVNIGDFSRPVKTKSGYHILKLLEKIPAETKEQLKKRLKDKIKNYDRYRVAQESLISRIKKTSNFNEDPKLLKSFSAKLTPEFFSYKWKQPEGLASGELASFGNDIYKLSDFSAFCKKNTRMRSQFDKNKPLDEATAFMYDEFIREKAIAHEEKNLEKKYPSFRSLMREYEEGILLFEATKMSVWDKANQDTLGLHEFYESQKSKYMFGERATIGTYFINSDDEKTVKKITKCAKKRDAEKTMARFNKPDLDLIAYEEKVVEAGSKELVGLLFKIADYQDKLEKDWIKQLKSEFNIDINQTIYNKLVK